jgi:hypothetical protein
MRILDKKSDYYDYIQDIYQDDALIFDRRDSYELDKQTICQWLTRAANWYWGYRHIFSESSKNCFLLMQIGATFWVFLVTTLINQNKIIDYDISLVTTWKNYDLPRVLIRLDLIDFDWKIHRQLTKTVFSETGYDPQLVYDKSDIIIQAINTKDYNKNVQVQYDPYGTFKPKTNNPIPLLKSSGIPTCVDPQEIYDAFEEYFSLEKTASERTDAEGTTNKDKIINHGFDTKVSFRGK